MPHEQNRITATAAATMIRNSRPGYRCGGTPSAPRANSHAGAQYSSSTVCPGWTLMIVSARPTRGGRKYGTYTWTRCGPGPTGSTVRPHEPGTGTASTATAGRMKKKIHANGMNRAVAAIEVPGGAVTGSTVQARRLRQLGKQHGGPDPIGPELQFSAPHPRRGPRALRMPSSLVASLLSPDAIGPVPDRGAGPMAV